LTSNIRISKDEFQLNQRQKIIIEALRERSIGKRNLADMYIGGLKVLINKYNPEKYSQSAHSLRELVSYLTDDIEVISKEDKVHREKMRILISQEDVLSGPTREYIDKQWFNLHNYFVNVCHHRIYIEYDEDYKNQILKLDYILTALFCPAYESIEEINKLVQIENPSEEDLELIFSLIKKEAHYRNFIRNLSNPKWFLLLKNKGVFKCIPKKGEYYEESKYFTKIAEELPQEVAETIKTLSDTNHEGAQVEFMRAILKMPVEIAKTLKKYIKKWMINSQIATLALYEEVIKLIIKLFEYNESVLGLELSRAILYIKHEEYEEEENLEKAKIFFSPDVSANKDSFFYKRYIEKLNPILKEKAPIDSFRMYVDLLNVAINIFKKEEKELKSTDDLSYYWRKLIDEHDYFTYNKDIKNILVNAIRDLVIFIGENRKGLLHNLLQILQQKEYSIFRRLELYILRKFPEIFRESIKEAVLNVRYFEEFRYFMEYYLLLKKEFSNSPKEIQAIYLKRVKSGPKIRKFKKTYKKTYKEKPDRELIELTIRQWQVQRLSPIREFLSHDIIESYNLTIEEIEKYDLFRESSSGIVFGPSSPISVDEMTVMSIDEIISYLSSFEAKSDFLDGTIGLGRTLRRVVEGRTKEFSDHSAIFIETESLHRFISFFLDGIKNAKKKKISVDWDPIIEMCESIVLKSVVIKEDHLVYEGDLIRDIKISIISLIREGLIKDENSIPFSLKDKVWSILKILVKDEDLTEEKELKWLTQNGSLWDLAINSIRGKAFNSIIQYGIWYSELLVKNKAPTQNIKIKLAIEVKEVLSDYLIYENEPTLTIRSLYGENLNRLLYLDKDWVTGHLNDIFPQDKDKIEYWEASWASYIQFNTIYKNTYKILKEQYMKAIDLISKEGLKTKLVSFSVVELSKHIMLLYIHGVEDIIDENSIVVKFFTNVPNEFKSIAIHYVGQHLKNFEKNKDFENILKRLKDLWSYRIKVAKNGDIKDFRRELTRFTIWVQNSVFEKEWVIQQFEETLNITSGSVDVFYDVLDTLLGYVEDFTLGVMNCVDKIIKYDIEFNQYLLYVDRYKSILREIFKSNNREAIFKAKDLIDYLSLRDFNYFGDLLRD